MIETHAATLSELMLAAGESFDRAWKEALDHGGYNETTARLEYVAGFFYRAGKCDAAVGA